MNLQQLLTEIHTDPLTLGYSNYLPNSPGKVVELINNQVFSSPKSRMISERGILEMYVDGPVSADAVLTKIESFALTAHPAAAVVKRVLKFLGSDGIDIGSPTSHLMLDVMVGAGAITSAEATKLKALSNKPSSRAEVLFGNNVIVTEQHLRDAGVV